MEYVLAKSSDAKTLAVMNKRLIEDERHPNRMELAELTERMESWLRGGYTGYLVQEKDSPVAYCLYRDDGDYYYLRQLFVEREHRRHGIGRELLDWMFGHVWTDKPVRLDVLAHNQRAITFYEAYGFRTGCLRMERTPDAR